MTIIVPLEGLCNRLRVLLSFFKQYSNLDVFWPIDEKISNTHFLDIFEPIEKINFLEKLPIKFDYQGFSPIHNNYQANYLLLKPTIIVLKRIKHFMNILGTNYDSCHIRRTDHTKIALKRKCLTTDRDFYNFIKNSKQEKVYVATDNLETQIYLLKIFGEKVIFNNGISNSKSLRKSSLIDAIVDIIICSNSIEFKGSGYSSFSDTIKIFKSVNYYEKNIKPLILNPISNDSDILEELKLEDNPV